MALIELARATGERRYLDLASFFLDGRGHGILGGGFGRCGPEHHLDHRPYRKLDEVVGHAVCAVFLNTVADDTIWVRQDVAGSARLTLEVGDEVAIEVHTQYPWDGEIVVRVALQRVWLRP